VELLLTNFHTIYTGISRPNLDPKGRHYGHNCTDGWFISTYNGSLYANGRYGWTGQQSSSGFSDIAGPALGRIRFLDRF
jgi:hypothetical protein